MNDDRWYNIGGIMAEMMIIGGEIEAEMMAEMMIIGGKIEAE